jgi:hypothetical protein
MGRDPRGTVNHPYEIAARPSPLLHQFCDTVYAGPRYIDAGHTRWLQSLLNEAQAIAAAIQEPGIDRQIARILAHAKRRKFFWAEADTRQLLEQLPPPPQPTTETLQQARVAMVSRLGKLFSKQSIKDLEHNRPLSAEKLARPFRHRSPRHPSSCANWRAAIHHCCACSGLFRRRCTTEWPIQPWIGSAAARSA